MKQPSTNPHPPGSFPGKLPNTLARWLLEPTRKVTDPAKRQRARLLSIFLLCMFLVFLSINLGYLLAIPGYRIPAADLVGYAVLLGTYLLSRTRWTSVAAVIMLIMFPMNVFSNVFEGTSEEIAVTLTFLIPGIILTSIFLNKSGVLIYGGLINLGIALLPMMAPEVVGSFSAVIGPFSLGVLTVTLLVIAMGNRDQIERSRQAEIRAAYDKTLEGWSRALEIRDKETEGHANRVTKLTILLASTFGIHGERLEHIFRGALLHDIGKMAIPDAILFKPGTLDAEEMAVMKTHPGKALEMLSGITYLKPALEVVACHHERWDGTGYPAGMRGEGIPLEARIFAVVDVWDALLSQRTYRAPWTQEAALKYLQEQSGKQFDPQVVERFLAIMKEAGG